MGDPGPDPQRVVIDHKANAIRIRHIEKCFGQGVHLTKDGRMLLGEGLLSKACRRSFQPRQFFLFDDILVYGHILNLNSKYTKAHVLPLEAVRVVKLPDTKAVTNGFQIIGPEKSITVCAGTPREKAAWIRHLTHASGHDALTLQEAQERSDHAPSWVPDRSVRQCMSCSRKFSQMIRRHHCRSCGDCICSGCSKSRMVIDSRSGKVRVCNSCAAARSSAAAAAPLPTTNEAQWQSTQQAQSGSGLGRKASTSSMSSVGSVGSDVGSESEGAVDELAGIEEAAEELSKMTLEHPTTFFDGDSDGVADGRPATNGATPPPNT